jgi:hypothetical protein
MEKNKLKDTYNELRTYLLKLHILYILLIFGKVMSIVQFRPLFRRAPFVTAGLYS